MAVDADFLNELGKLQSNNSSKALSDSISAIKTDKATKEDYAVVAKAALQVDNLDVFQYSAMCAVDATKPSTLEDYFTLENEFGSYQIEWAEKKVKRELRDIEENPSNQKLTNFHYNRANDLISFGLLPRLMRSVPHVTQMINESGIPIQDLIKKHNANLGQLTSERRQELLLESAHRLFQEGQSILEEYSDSQREYAMNAGKKAKNDFSTAVSLVDASTPKVNTRMSEEKKEETRIARIPKLMEKASMLEYMLNATISPNGQTQSLYLDSERTYYLNELKSTYDQLDKLSPNYLPPRLPSAEGIKSYNSNSANTKNNNGGGCYVATAVYGSYDCPQVWTLRRYRDYTLAETWYGQAFIRIYYAISPTLVKWFGEAEWFKSMWKPKLDKMVKSLNEKGIADTPYQDRDW